MTQPNLAASARAGPHCWPGWTGRWALRGRTCPADTEWLPVRHACRPARPADALPPPPGDRPRPTSTVAPARRHYAAAAGLAGRPASPGRLRVRPGPASRWTSWSGGPAGHRRSARERSRAGPHGRGARTRRAAAHRPRSPRRARLQLRHINPWTVFKFACALSIALFFIWLLTVAALYGILDATGVIGRINDAWTTVAGRRHQPADPAQHRACSGRP